MIRIITLIILVTSIFSCKNNTKSNKENINIDTIVPPKQELSNNYLGLSKPDLLSKLEEDINKKQTNKYFYNSLDSISPFVDGADAEYYLEIYAKSLINDCNNFKKYKNKKDIDINVITFFTKSTSYSKNIAKSIKECKLYKGREFKVQDSDGYVNLREGTGTDSHTIRKVKNDEKVRAIYIDSVDWKAVITSDNLIGFIHSSRLKPVTK